jgi:hypothetical protein
MYQDPDLPEGKQIFFVCVMMLGAGMTKKKNAGAHVRRRDDWLHDVPFGVNFKYSVPKKKIVFPLK